MTFNVGDIVKFSYGIVYGIVVESTGGMVCVKWFDATEAHFYPMCDLEKVSDV